jgi:hypothetical protein
VQIDAGVVLSFMSLARLIANYLNLYHNLEDKDLQKFALVTGCIHLHMPITSGSAHQES